MLSSFASAQVLYFLASSERIMSGGGWMEGQMMDARTWGRVDWETLGDK